jgi:hypothetical protein
VNPDEFLRFAAEYQACFDRYRAATQGQSVLWVWYEDLTGGVRARSLSVPGCDRECALPHPARDVQAGRGGGARGGGEQL